MHPVSLAHLAGTIDMRKDLLDAVCLYNGKNENSYGISGTLQKSMPHKKPIRIIHPPDF